MSGPLSPYEFTYVINETTGYVVGQTDTTFDVQMNFESSLLGEYQETIYITFNDQSIIKDLDLNKMQTSEVSVEVPFQLIVISDEEKAAVSSQSSLSIISLILTFGTSTFIQVVLGGTIEATWLLLGTLQLMSLLPLLNMNLPVNFREFSKNLAVLNGEPQAIPNIFKGYYDSLDLVIEPFNPFFEMMNFKTNYLLLNAGRKVMIWIIIIMFSSITYLLNDLADRTGKIGKLINKIDSKMRYGIIIRALSQSYLSMVLSTVLNVYMISWSGEDVSISSNLVALFFAILMMYIPIVVFNVIY